MPALRRFDSVGGSWSPYMPQQSRLTRRTVLTVAGGSVASIILANGAVNLAAGEVDHTYQTLQTDGDVDLVLDWAEFYNGEQLEAQDTPVSHDSGNPLVTLENVLPGDSGRLAFGLRTANEQPAQLEFLFRLVEEAENGLTEPEISAGDDSPDSGELEGNVDVRAWYDDGVSLGETTIYGACDGTFDDVGESQTFEGSLAAGLSDEWRPLDAAPDDDQETCLGPDEGLCFAIEWELPEDLPGVNDNVIAGDSVDIEIGFRGATCN